MDYIRTYQTEMPNAKKTLNTSVVLNDVYKKILNPSLRERFQQILPYGSLFFWDFGVKAAKELKRGMSVSIICGTRKYDCNIVEIFEDQKGELGDIFEWVRMYEAPWKNVFALNILNKENITSDKIFDFKHKTIPVTKTFLKVTDTALKNQVFTEGRSYDVTLSKYERSNLARCACIAHYGANCEICKFDFFDTYGELGKGFIHIHHKVPLSKITESYQVDPIKDLIPVCANCHAMLHAKQGEAINVESLKEIFKNHTKR